MTLRLENISHYTTCILILYNVVDEEQSNTADAVWRCNQVRNVAVLASVTTPLSTTKRWTVIVRGVAVDQRKWNIKKKTILLWYCGTFFVINSVTSWWHYIKHQVKQTNVTTINCTTFSSLLPKLHRYTYIWCRCFN